MVDFPSHMPQNSSVKCSYIKRAFDFASHTCDIVLVSMHLSNSITNHIMKFVDFKSVQRPKKQKTNGFFLAQIEITIASKGE